MKEIVHPSLDSKVKKAILGNANTQKCRYVQNVVYLDDDRRENTTSIHALNTYVSN
jgi:hypothetical protein